MLPDGGTQVGEDDSGLGGARRQMRLEHGDVEQEFGARGSPSRSARGAIPPPGRSGSGVAVARSHQRERSSRSQSGSSYRSLMRPIAPASMAGAVA